VAKPIVLFISATGLLVISAVRAAGAEEIFTDAQWGQKNGSSTAASATESPVGSSLLAIGGSLAVVIAAALVLGWLVKRLGVQRLVQVKGRYVEVLESVPLGFKRHASLVRIGDIVVLVGVGEHELVTLATLPASTVVREVSPAVVPLAPTSRVPGPLVPSPPMQAPPDPAFRSLLAKVIKG